LRHAALRLNACLSAKKWPETLLFLKISALKAALLQNGKAGKVLRGRRWIVEPQKGVIHAGFVKRACDGNGMRNNSQFDYRGPAGR
jgi:hypothetical protein